MFHSTKRTRRQGFTLVELLVVIGVIVVLLAIAIPAMRFDMEDRNIREASRAVNAYLVAAQSRAAEKNRPVGVWMERRNGSPRESIRLYMADVPPPYIGDFSSARAMISETAGLYTASFSFSTGLPALIKVGDLIQFDYKGPWYRIKSVSPLSTPPVEVTFDLNVHHNPPTFHKHVAPSAIGVSVPYQIQRAPIKSAVGSIELPKTSSIDLNLSGLGLVQGVRKFATATTTDESPVVVMFSPSGRVDRVYVHGTPFVPQETIHLLIGREELIDDPNTNNLGGTQTSEDDEDAFTNLWVSIGAQTGSITTQELKPPTDTAAPLDNQVIESREFANNKHQMGGG